MFICTLNTLNKQASEWIEWMQFLSFRLLSLTMLRKYFAKYFAPQQKKTFLRNESYANWKFTTMHKWFIDWSLCGFCVLIFNVFISCLFFFSSSSMFYFVSKFYKCYYFEIRSELWIGIAHSMFVIKYVFLGNWLFQ